MAAVLLSSDLMLASKISGASQRSGTPVVVASSVAALAEKVAGSKLVIIDLSTPGVSLAELVSRLKVSAEAPRVIAFGPHVQENLLQAATDAGCDAVMSRGQFHAQVDSILQQFG